MLCYIYQEIISTKKAKADSAEGENAEYSDMSKVKHGDRQDDGVKKQESKASKPTYNTKVILLGFC